jgi:hypothetical protein
MGAGAPPVSPREGPATGPGPDENTKRSSPRQRLGDGDADDTEGRRRSMKQSMLEPGHADRARSCRVCSLIAAGRVAKLGRIVGLSSVACTNVVCILTRACESQP